MHCIPQIQEEFAASMRMEKFPVMSGQLCFRTLFGLSRTSKMRLGIQNILCRNTS